MSYDCGSFLTFIGKNSKLRIEFPEELTDGLCIQIKFPTLDVANPDPFYNIFRDKYWHKFDEKNLICLLCFRKYALMSTLYTHMNMHLGIMPFVCEYCPKERFYSERVLKLHVKDAHPDKIRKRGNCNGPNKYRKRHVVRVNVHKLLEKSI